MNIKKIKIFNGATKEWVESILDVSEINKKADKTYVDKFVKDEIAKVVNSAPEAFDTLKEVADWIVNDETGAAAMANEIAQLKQDVDQVELDLASIELNTKKIIISNTVKTQ